jgi:hypothetical protein
VVLANDQSKTFNGLAGGLMSKKTPKPVPGTTRAVNIVQLGALLELAVTRAQLPKAINSFNAGRTISFGPLAVNPNGITIHHRSLPWSAVKEARILMRNTVLVKKSGIPPLKMEASRVPQLLPIRHVGACHTCPATVHPRKYSEVV